MTAQRPSIAAGLAADRHLAEEDVPGTPGWRIAAGSGRIGHPIATYIVWSPARA